MRIRQLHSYEEPNAEFIVTLCDSLRNHLHSKLFHTGFDTGYFPPIRLSTINYHFYAHPPSHPCTCFALHRKNRYEISIAPVIAKALLIIICTCPSKSVLLLSFLVLSCIQNKQTSSYPETLVLRCWGSLVTIMYKLTRNQPWWY